MNDITTFTTEDQTNVNKYLDEGLNLGEAMKRVFTEKGGDPSTLRSFDNPIYKTTGDYAKLMLSLAVAVD